jgi:hypothetical protein
VSRSVARIPVLNGLMRRGLVTGFATLLTLMLLVAGPSSAAPAQTGKKNPRQLVVKAFGSAETAGAIATATASCPKTARPTLGPWRAISGGFEMRGVVPVFSIVGQPPLPPSGSGVVYESRKIGQRSWRVSAQSLSGNFSLKVFLYCQNGVPKMQSASSTVATPGTPEVGPAAVTHCSSGKSVAGGFSTPPPFTATGAANTVIGSMPSGNKGWQAEVVSNQASSLTSYVYCAKRKQARLGSSRAGESSSVATTEDDVAYANAYDPQCPNKGRFIPGGGGFSEQGATASQYLIPVTSHSQGSGRSWHAHALKVGSGVPVSLSAVLLCG